jgi:ATP-binding cassette subfamily B protein
MNKHAQKRRDRQITRAIHALFWRANWQTKYHLVLSLIFQFPALVLLHIYIPLNIAYGVQAIVDKQFELVPHYAWQIVGCSVLFGILWVFRGLATHYNGVMAGVYLQRKVFSNYLHKDPEFYNSTYLGSLGAQASRLREALNTEYNMVFFNGIPKQLVVVGGGIIVIATKSWQLAAVTLVMMIAVLSFTLLMSSWRLQYRRRVSQASSDLAGGVGDALTHVHAVKSFAAEAYEATRLDKTLGIWRQAQFASWNSAVPSEVGRLILATTASAILLVLTARLYQRGAISIAIVALIQLYVVKMIASTHDIAETLKSYESAMGSAYQPVATMMVQSTITDAAKPQPMPRRISSLALDDVSFRYPDATGDRQAVCNFDLTIRQGEKVGLVGYSGSGKTTLSKLLLRFMDVTDGAITINGRDIRKLAQADLRRAIGYVPQEPLLFHRTVDENIAYGNPAASRTAITRAAKAAYVDEFVDQLSSGYQTLVGERGVKLSGGQRQRVAIARAILKDAPILVLDEATSALDSQSEQYIQRALWNLMKDRTAIVIAHRLSTIQRMDKIVVMDKGKIVQVGSHEQLLKDKKGIYARLWAHQSGGYIAAPTAEAA